MIMAQSLRGLPQRANGDQPLIHEEPEIVRFAQQSKAVETRV
jgi:hypothetical protein